MPKITFIEHDGTAHTVEALPKRSVMAAALRHDVPGIVAECGGSCSCATCHVYVDPAWVARTGEPGEMEREMLESAADLGPTSRLSCQIKYTDALDGLLVRIPATQAADQKWGA